MERLYAALKGAVVRAAPWLGRIGVARLERPVAVVEAGVKGALFDCRMCGDCALSKTGMSCPMNCPKGMRNGPCGGVRADGQCEVYPAMPCVWVKAYEGSLTMRGGSTIAEVLPPLNHAGKGASTWLASSVSGPRRTHERGAAHPHDIGPDPSAPLVDLPGHSSRGRLERVLRRGEFAVTAELNPPDSADADDVGRPRRSSRAGSTASTPPTARARIATCPASPSARC